MRISNLKSTIDIKLMIKHYQGFTFISRSERAFTLIELLITVTIIGILMSIAIPSFNKFLVKSRDAKRKSEIKVIQSSLEHYIVDQNNYPTESQITNNGVLKSDTAISSGTKVYLGRIPKDPLSGSNWPGYKYSALPSNCNNTTTMCTSYCLFANLEDRSQAETNSVCTHDYQYNYEVAPQ